ncbi:TPA: Cag pathogenicity island protein Cag12 [Klebsiella aerogenes]|nr:Cag pathogenicity island protein Cag12 [Klebsiella aerogenes]
MMKTINILLLLMMLIGCSSPPPPVSVEWDKSGESVNIKLSQWNDNTVINPSPVVNGKWLLSVHSTQFNETLWPPDVFYAVAHSTRIVVAAPSGTAFFTATSWLRQHGAKGVIEYQPATQCLTCSNTYIYFSH